MEYFSAIKKHEILSLLIKWTGLNYEKLSQTEKGEYRMISHTCM